MSDKPNLCNFDFFALPAQSCIQLIGADAVKFAQAQFSNDLHKLNDGDWQFSSWLNPKGRVIALFALLRHSATELTLLLPDDAAHSAQALVDALRRYVFRSKVQIQLRTDWHVQSAFSTQPASAPTTAHFHTQTDADAQHHTLVLRGVHGLRYWCISTTAARTDTQHALRWLEEDLRHGIPRLDAQMRERWTVQQLSLANLSAYSVKKGCYPGQEIVARTHFLGRAPRHLHLLHGSCTLPSASTVDDGAGQSLGDIICHAGAWAIAVLPALADATALHIAGETVQLADFLPVL